jgi:biotin carboxyl carrier protein
VLSTDHTFEEHETEPQVLWLWSPALAGPIQIVRKSLRVYAAEAQSTSNDEADGGAYATPMPAKVLDILVKSGEKVEEGE